MATEVIQGCGHPTAQVRELFKSCGHPTAQVRELSKSCGHPTAQVRELSMSCGRPTALFDQADAMPTNRCCCSDGASGGATVGKWWGDPTVASLLAQRSPHRSPCRISRPVLGALFETIFVARTFFKKAGQKVQLMKLMQISCKLVTQLLQLSYHLTYTCL